MTKIIVSPGPDAQADINAAFARGDSVELIPGGYYPLVKWPASIGPFCLIITRGNLSFGGPDWGPLPILDVVDTGEVDALIIGDHAYHQAVSIANVTVRRLEITGTGGHAGSIGIGANQPLTSIRDVKIEQVYCHDLERDGPDMEVGQANVGGVQNVQIHSCRIENVRLGVDFGNHSQTYVEGLCLGQNEIRNWRSAAILCYGPFDGTRIQDNDCRTSLGLGHGIEIGDSTYAGAGWPNKNCQVKGNLIAGLNEAGKHGIFAYGFDNMELAHNTIRANREAIYLTKGSQLFANLACISHNTLIVDGDYIFGYVAEMDVREQLLSANYIESRGAYAAYVYGGTSTFKIGSNRLFCNAAGGFALIRIRQGARGVIEHNTANSLDISVDVPGDVQLFDNSLL